jgi:hypothetical protein
MLSEAGIAGLDLGRSGVAEGKAIDPALVESPPSGR